MTRYINQPGPASAADGQDDADPEQAARTIVLRRLNSAPRTRAELRSDLLRRGIPDEAADRVLDRFTEVGLIDDEAYAHAWVESRQRTRGTARSVLRQELRGKGIADSEATAALETIDEESERVRALALVGVKARSMTRLEPEVRARRLVSMLMRRGYRQAIALSVVREALGEFDDSDDGGLTQ